MRKLTTAQRSDFYRDKLVKETIEQAEQKLTPIPTGMSCPECDQPDGFHTNGCVLYK